jgi:hypothetical protein
MLRALLIVVVMAGCAGLKPDAVSEESSALIVPPGPVRSPCDRTTYPCVDLYVVAHPDDDLLFMNPDIQTSIRTGNKVVVVIENGSVCDPAVPGCGETQQYAIDRERGNLNAYAFMAQGWAGAFDRYVGVNGESRGTIPPGFASSIYAPQVCDPNLQTCTPILQVPQFQITSNYGNTVTVMFVRLAEEYVTAIWARPDFLEAYTRACPGDSATTCEPNASTPRQQVTQQTLLDFYGSVMRDFAVTSVSTLDHTSVYSDAWGTQGALDYYTENENHIDSAMFALTAASKFQAAPSTTWTVSLRSYRGYSTLMEPQNLQLHGSEQWDKEDAFAHYALYDSAALRPDIRGDTNPLDGPTLASPPDYFNNHRYDLGPGNTDSYIQTYFYGDVAYESRKFVTRTVLGTAPLTGRLRSGTGSCLYGTSTTDPFSPVSLQPCDSSPSWTITSLDQIQLAGTTKCLTTNGVDVGLADCSLVDANGSRLGSTMFLFGNGQIRTPNARCLTYLNSAVSADCTAYGGGYSFISTISASSSGQGSSPSSAVDGNPNTAWYSGSGDSQWLTLDLGYVHPNISGLKISWLSYPDQLHVDVSDDNTTWITVYQSDLANPYTAAQVEGAYYPDIPFQVSGHPIHGRYIRVYCTHHAIALPWYSVAEIKAIDHVASVTPPWQDWTLIFDPLALLSTQFSDSTEIPRSSSYYRTLSIVNHDVCVRCSIGVTCSEWTSDRRGTRLGNPYIVSSGYSDAYGWGAPAYGDTVRGVWFGRGGWPPVACGRGIWGPSCNNGLSSSDYADSSGWTANYYYDTLRFADLYNIGSIDVCGRGYWGIYCSRNASGTTWGPATLWTTEFSNPAGWSDITNASTIQFGDINGDGALDVCGRGDYGMFCVRNDQTDSFSNGHFWSFNSDRTNAPLTHNDFSDYDPVANWATSSSYYDSIRLIDINRDGFADVCGRGPLGVYCALSTGTSFEQKRLVDLDLADSYGWGYPFYGGTLTFGDLDGDARVDMCARGGAGLYCKSTY